MKANIWVQLWIPQGSSAIIMPVLKNFRVTYQAGEMHDADGRLLTRG